MGLFLVYFVFLVILATGWFSYLLLTIKSKSQSDSNNSKFSSRIFFSVLIIILILQFISIIGIAGEDEMGQSRYFFWRFMADSFAIFKFPTVTLLGYFTQNGLLWFLGLLLNTFIYSFMIERVVVLSSYVIRNRTRQT